MRHTNDHWRELARLENLAARYHCADAGEPHWLCGVLRDAIEWNRKWLMRTERLGTDGLSTQHDTPQRLEAP